MNPIKQINPICVSPLLLKCHSIPVERDFNARTRRNCVSIYRSDIAIASWIHREGILEQLAKFLFIRWISRLVVFRIEVNPSRSGAH
jgi:hypothetical protein